MAGLRRQFGAALVHVYFESDHQTRKSIDESVARDKYLEAGSALPCTPDQALRRHRALMGNVFPAQRGQKRNAEAYKEFQTWVCRDTGINTALAQELQTCGLYGLLSPAQAANYRQISERVFVTVTHTATLLWANRRSDELVARTTKMLQSGEVDAADSYGNASDTEWAKEYLSLWSEAADKSRTRLSVATSTAVVRTIAQLLTNGGTVNANDLNTICAERISDELLIALATNTPLPMTPDDVAAIMIDQKFLKLISRNLGKVGLGNSDQWAAVYIRTMDAGNLRMRLRDVEQRWTARAANDLDDTEVSELKKIFRNAAGHSGALDKDTRREIDFSALEKPDTDDGLGHLDHIRELVRPDATEKVLPFAVTLRHRDRDTLSAAEEVLSIVARSIEVLRAEHQTMKDSQLKGEFNRILRTAAEKLPPRQRLAIVAEVREMVRRELLDDIA